MKVNGFIAIGLVALALSACEDEGQDQQPQSYQQFDCKGLLTFAQIEAEHRGYSADDALREFHKRGCGITEPKTE